MLELSRLLRVARGTVQSRLDQLERTGVVTGYGPDVDVAAAGFPVQAFVTLEIAQGALDDVAAELRELPAVLEAYATTGIVGRAVQAGGVLARGPAGDPAGPEPLVDGLAVDERGRAVGGRAAAHAPVAGQQAPPAPRRAPGTEARAGRAPHNHVRVELDVARRSAHAARQAGCQAA